MENGFKRFLSLAMAIMMVFSNIPTAAFASGVEGECLHNNVQINTTATCTEAGETITTCLTCGQVLSTEAAEATGHSYVDGACACGELDPDAPPAEDEEQIPSEEPSEEVTEEASAEETEEEPEETPALCTLTEGCILDEGHEGECFVEAPCTVTEGCVLMNGHEGECVPDVALYDVVIDTEEKLQALLNAGGTVTLNSNVTVVNGLTIPADVEVTLDLGGYRISQEKAQTGAYSMITNNGDLTITGTGEIYYGDRTQYTADVNYVSNTILNNGKLSVEGAVTIINQSTPRTAKYGYPHAIDTNGELVVNHEQASIVCTDYSAIRIWCTTDDDTSVTIKAGHVWGAIDLHNVNGNANKGSLVIEDGDLKKGMSSAAIRLLDFGGDIDELTIAVSGGTFAGGIVHNDYVNKGAAPKISITGGTFDTNVARYVANGYSLHRDMTADTEKYTVVPAAQNFAVGNDTFEYLNEAFNAAQNGDTVKLLQDVEIAASVTNGSNGVILDLNGYTLSQPRAKNNQTPMLKNMGTLTILDSSEAKTGKFSYTDTENSANAAIMNIGTLVIEAGTFTGSIVNNGTISIIGGTFDTDVSAYVAEGYVQNNGVVVEKPAVVIPEEIEKPEDITDAEIESVAGEIEEIKVAIKKPVVDNVPDGVSMVISLAKAVIDKVEDAVAATKLIYNVSPKNSEGEKVSEFEKEITFELPIPNSVTKTHAKVYHNNDPMGIQEILTRNGSKYIKVASRFFSEFAVEPVDAPTYVAMVGEQGYDTLSAAIAAAKAGNTITFVADITEDVTVNKSVTIAGAGKTYTGKMKMTNKANVTVKNVNFDGKGYNGYAVETRGANYLTIEDCTAKNYGYGFVQLVSSTVLTTVKNVTVSNVNYGVKTDYSNAVVLENVKIDAAVAAVLNSNYGSKTITIKDSELSILSTWTRNDTIKSTYVFEGENAVDEFVIDEALDTIKLANAESTLTAPEGVTITTTVEEREVAHIDGVYKVVPIVRVAQIGETQYRTLSAAIAAAQTGNTIVLLADITEDVTVSKSVTIDGADKTYTGNILVSGSTVAATIKNVNFVNGSEYAIKTNGIKSITVENCTVENYGYGFLYANKSTPTVVVKNVTVENCNYGFHYVYGSTATLENVKMTNVETGLYIQNYVGKTINLKDCEISSTYIWERSGYSAVQTFNFAGANTVGTLSDSQYAKYILTDEDATLTAPNGATVTTTVEEREVAHIDGAYKVVPIVRVAQIGETQYRTLSAAIAAAQTGNTIVLLADITEDVTVNKSVTIDGANFNYTGNISVKGSTVDAIVKNVNFVGGTGYAITTNSIKRITVEDCTAKGYGYGFLYANKSTSTVVVKNVKVEDCNYGFRWVYGSTATLENVTMNDVMYGLDIQNYAAKTINLKNCDISSIAVQERENASAVQTFNFAGANTVGTLYAGQYAKYILTDEDATLTAPNGATVATTVEEREVAHIDGVYKVVPIVRVAQIGETQYRTLSAAIAAAQTGNTIVLLADITEDVTVSKSVTIDGANFNYTGNISVEGSTVAVTVKNVNFEGGSGYAITTNRIKSITVENCTVENYGYGFLYSNKSTPTVVIKNVKVEDCNYGFRWVYGSTATLENVTMTDVMYGLDIQNYAAKTINLKNCEISSIAVQERENASAVQTFNFEGQNTAGALSESQYAKYILTAEDATLTAPEGATVTTTVADREVAHIDGAYKVVPIVRVAKIGETEYRTLSAAIAAAKAGETITFLTDITENVTVSKSVTIDGADKTYTGNILVSGSTVAATIKNVNFVNGSEYAIKTNGIKSITVENCTVENYGYGFLYANKSTPTVVVKNVTVENCNYGFRWVYGSTATLENVTMTDVMYGLDIQNYAAKTINLKNCEISSIAVQERENASAVQTFNFAGENTVGTLTDSQYAKYVLTAENATLSAPEGATVTTTVADREVAHIDGTYKVVPIVRVAKIGETQYRTLSAAIAAAQAGDTIELIADVTEDVTVNKKLTINGAKNEENNYTYTGNMTLNNVTVTIENVNFVKGQVSKNKKTGANANITVKNCDFDGQGMDTYAINLGGTGNIVIENVTCKDYGYGFLQASSSNNSISVKGVTISDVNYGLKIDRSNNVTVENADIVARNYALYDSNYASKTYTIKNSKLTSIEIWERTDATGIATFNIEGTNTVEVLEDSQYAKYVLTTEDATLITPEVKELEIISGVEQYKVVYDTNAYKLVKAVAKNIDTGEFYVTLEEALNDAESGKTVIPLIDIETDIVMVPAGVKLDLNGKTLTAKYAIVSFGDVIDSTDGNGGIEISADAAHGRTSLMANNEYFPIYDSANGCYRFFSTSSEFIAVRAGAKGDGQQVSFGFTMYFKNHKAYELLKTDGHGVNMNVYIARNKSDSPAAYRIYSSTLKTFAEKALEQIAAGGEVTAAIRFTVKGLKVLNEGDVLTAYADMTGNGTGVSRVTGTENYTIPAAE